MRRSAKNGAKSEQRRKPGSKHHASHDADGIPLVVILTAANMHDVNELIPLVDAIPPVGGKRGRPRRKPERVQADTAHDSRTTSGAASQTRHHSRHSRTQSGTWKWIGCSSLGRTHAILGSINFDAYAFVGKRRDDIHEGFVELAESLICLYFAKTELS